MSCTTWASVAQADNPFNYQSSFGGTEKYRRFLPENSSFVSLSCNFKQYFVGKKQNYLAVNQTTFAANPSKYRQRFIFPTKFIKPIRNITIVD
ncbi:hypothetical protein [Neisseria benedictiae]|uniref:hypothetical protein n=1 Tax=Neisseria benedictiae TaxID=2830649 RepID=UPI00128FF043|nr:hypothetical protein [Neisseria benedictiae]